MSNVIETKTISHYRIDIIDDPDPINPRKEFDNLATLACFHRRYNLGDESIRKEYPRPEDFHEWLKENSDKLVTMNLYLYDHSGLTISVTPFSCSWDSGIVGIGFVEKEKILEAFALPEWNEEAEKKAREVIEAEVKTYDTFLRGEVYGYRIIDTRDGDERDSCWGFFGKEYCLEEAEGVVSCYVDKDTHFEDNAVESLVYVTLKVRVKHMPDVDPLLIMDASKYEVTPRGESQIIEVETAKFTKEAL